MLVNSSKNAKRLSWETSDKGLTEGSGVSVGIKVLVGVEVGGIDVGEGGTGVSVDTTTVGGTGVAAGSALSQPASRVRTIVTAKITLQQVVTIFSLHLPLPLASGARCLTHSAL